MFLFLKKKETKVRSIWQRFQKQLSKVSFWEQILKTILNCFHEQNYIWELKYGKQFFLAYSRKGIVQLCTIQKFPSIWQRFQKQLAKVSFWEQLLKNNS